MHNADEIAEDASEIADIAAEIAEDISEEVEEAETAVAEEPSTGETPHVVSLEERLSECLQRLAVLEERQSQTQEAVQQVEVQAEQAEETADAALTLALSEPLEEEPLTEPEQVEVPPAPVLEERKKPSLWEWLLGAK